jgi:ketosteroid isomerase-like protein
VKAIFWLDVMLTISAGCSQPRWVASESQDEIAIHAGEVGWANDWASRDVEKIVSDYADDAVVQIPGWGVLVGKDALRAGILQILRADLGVKLSFRPLGSAGGESATRRGSYSLTQIQPPEEGFTVWLTQEGPYTVEYRRLANGSWVVERQKLSGDAEAILPARLRETGILDIYSAGHSPG